MDLLFLKQGGLCASLGKQCCFYANKSGIIRESLSLVRQNLEDRKKVQEASEGWYQKLFSGSPWAMALLTGLAGPLAILLLSLTPGPCLINWFVHFICSWIESVQLMVLRAQ